MISRILLILLLFLPQISRGQTNIPRKIESVFSANPDSEFSGAILVYQQSNFAYSWSVSWTMGWADRDSQTSMDGNNQFVIGSISKQFTAVLVLREFESGRLELHTPIHKYLPELTQSWADTVTVHHLLTHMHGISALDKPTLFSPGSRFNYGLSNTGYFLLSQIVERTSGKTFALLSAGLFKKCRMKNTFHPDTKKYKYLVKGYTEQPDGTMAFDSMSFQNAPAAGGFVSTAGDLVLWNNCLHNGKLLKKRTYEMMTSKQKGAVRDHPLFGTTDYGYGITVTTADSLLQLGQTGYAPGFISMNFYFPETKTSVVVLSNVAQKPWDLEKTFFFHVQILETVRTNIRR